MSAKRSTLILLSVCLFVAFEALARAARTEKFCSPAVCLQVDIDRIERKSDGLLYYLIFRQTSQGRTDRLWIERAVNCRRTQRSGIEVYGNWDDSSFGGLHRDLIDPSKPEGRAAAFVCGFQRPY